MAVILTALAPMSWSRVGKTEDEEGKNDGGRVYNLEKFALFVSNLMITTNLSLKLTTDEHCGNPFLSGKKSENQVKWPM